MQVYYSPRTLALVLVASTNVALTLQGLGLAESPKKASSWLCYVGAPVAQLVEHRAITREVVSSTPAGLSLRVLK